ncbi:MAG TPA: septal ring lytic transglycosylase RlpA family protein [Thermoleophilaceae bacterium]
MKTRLHARGRRLRIAALVAGLMTTGSAYAATTPAQQPTVTISGAGDVQKVRYGHEISLSGRAAGGSDVRLEHAPAGRDWRLLATSHTAAGGGYSFSVRARQSGAYRAVASGKASAPHRVKVVARLSGRASRNVNIGRSARVRGSLKPGLRGRTVRLQLRSHGGWKTVDRARTGSGGRFNASWNASRPGSYRLRLRFSGDSSNLAVSRGLRGRTNVYRPGAASWYGPGFYGGHTACGYTLDASVKGVANKSLPCGSKVRFRYHGRTTVATVIDRGPYSGSREWDLTPATKEALGFGSTGTVWSTR